MIVPEQQGILVAVLGLAAFCVYILILIKIYDWDKKRHAKPGVKHRVWTEVNVIDGIEVECKYIDTVPPKRL